MHAVRSIDLPTASRSKGTTLKQYPRSRSPNAGHALVYGLLRSRWHIDDRYAPQCDSPSKTLPGISSHGRVRMSQNVHVGWTEVTAPILGLFARGDLSDWPTLVSVLRSSHRLGLSCAIAEDAASRRTEYRRGSRPRA